MIFLLTEKKYVNLYINLSYNLVQMGTVDDHMKNRVHITQSHNAEITQCNTTQ